MKRGLPILVWVLSLMLHLGCAAAKAEVTPDECIGRVTLTTSGLVIEHFFNAEEEYAGDRHSIYCHRKQETNPQKLVTSALKGVELAINREQTYLVITRDLMSNLSDVVVFAIKGNALVEIRPPDGTDSTATISDHMWAELEKYQRLSPDIHYDHTYSAFVGFRAHGKQGVFRLAGHGGHGLKANSLCAYDFTTGKCEFGEVHVADGLDAGRGFTPVSH